MRKLPCCCWSACRVSCLFAQTEAAQSANPPILGITWAKGVNGLLAPARRSPNMTYHGGKIMTTAKISAIFWGTTWGSYTGDKMSGMDSYYAGWNGSNYAKTSD